jgi:phosphatidylglycerol lysyltransferase
MQAFVSRHLKVRPEFVGKLAVFGVAVNGLIILWSTLLNQLFNNLLLRRAHSGDITVGIPLILGLTLLYLSSLLARRKRVAWTVAMAVYAFILVLNVMIFIVSRHPVTLTGLGRNFLLPLLVVGGLLLTQAEFTVKSDVRSFTHSLRFVAFILFVALLYGVIGFQLLDKHDFHQEIGLWEAIHRTIDQFDLTTGHSLVPYTRRARLFLDSLSIVSIGAVGYAMVSLFQPLRARFADQTNNRDLMRRLLEQYPANSEDFFKLWAHDKSYFVSQSQRAALAFHVNHSVALVIGDPAGEQHYFDELLTNFDELCYVNDWLPAFIHVEPRHAKLYENHDFTLQKIGEEAVLNLEHFRTTVVRDKYFRQIHNRFTKQGYSVELLQPPHNPALISRLRVISDEWLARPGHVERGLMMGYFSEAYMQQCPVMVVRDAASTIQGFINQIPSFDQLEANFDMLRQSDDSPGNINDFLLMGFIEELAKQGFERLNLGLSPLAGVADSDENRTLIDNAMRFAYANGDRLYSFSGLHRFKAKYEPQWSERYIAYRSGFRGFTRTVNALNRTMKVPAHLLHAPRSSSKPN